jgi:hypothetical protein
MLGFFKKRAFRSQVRKHLSYLLGFGLNDDVLHRLLRAYPGIWKAVDADFLTGETALNSAVGVLAIAFTREIERRPVSDLARMERYIVHNEGEAKSGVERGIKTFLTQLLVQMDLGEVADELYKYTISEIIGAIRGISNNERMARRLVAPLVQPSTE